jgi:DNA (cytosine-5)-methyltransferase 1
MMGRVAFDVSESVPREVRQAARPIAVDLFSGAGGMSLGVEQAGFDIAAAVEYDPIHAAIHELNFPYTSVICGDLAKLNGDDIRRAAGIDSREVDMVFGGPPCQGFSLIGQRVLNDPRNSLVFHFVRIVQELQPRIFVLENVPGMATGGHACLLRELIDRFGESGYRVRLPYKIVNAGWYGVPQDRKRLVLLGARKDVSLPDYPVPTTRLRNRRPNGSGALLDELPDGPNVSDAIRDLPDIEDFEELLGDDTVRVHLGEGSAYSLALRGELADAHDYSYRRTHDPGVLTGCRRARHTVLSRSRFAATTPGTTEEVSRFYRLDWNGVCNTLRSGTGSERGAYTAPRPIHPQYARCISVREAARLHSYPDWFRFHATIWHGFRQIGNSVPPRLAQAIAESVRMALEFEPIVPGQSLRMGHTELARYNMTRASAHFGVSSRVIPPRRRLAGATKG